MVGDIEDKGEHPAQSGEQETDMVSAWKNKYLLLLADLENTKKRLARTSVQEVAAEKEKLLRDMLPIADGLDLAHLHTESDGNDRNILQGIELIQNILTKFFSKNEVQVIEAWGKQFDPRLHEALGVIRNPKVGPNTVVRVEKKGYMFRDKLLRPAQVLVASR